MAKEKSKDWSVPIAVAVIGLLGTCITAFFAIPGFQGWVGSLFSPSQPKSLAIEQVPQQVFAYYGNAEDLGGFAKLNFVYNGIDTYPYYVLDYNIPEGQIGYAGLAFQFDNGVNVTEYTAIEFTIQFTGLNIPIELYVKDIGKKRSSIRIISTGADKMKLRYDLENFKDVDFDALKEVGFAADNEFSAGRYIITVHAIRFVH